MRNRIIYLALFCLTLSGPQFLNADVVIECREVGDDVVCVGSGSLDISSLGLFTNSSTSGGLMLPEFGNLILGDATGSPAALYRLPASVRIGPIGTGGNLLAPDFGSTENWGIVGAIGAGRDHIIVPAGYVAGDVLPTISSTYLNESFDSLGLTPGTYGVSWGSGSNEDRLRINIVSSVPEPSGVLLAFLGLGVASLRRYRR